MPQLEDLSDDKEQDDDDDAEASAPALPNMEALFGSLDTAVHVGERLFEPEGLRLEGALELAGLQRLSLAELAKKVALQVRDLGHELDEAEVKAFGRGHGRRGGGPAVRGRRTSIAFLRAAAVLRLEEGATGSAEKRALRGTCVANRAVAEVGRCRDIV